MSRKPRLDMNQVQAIRNDFKKTQKELSIEFGVSLLTINKVKNFKGAYKIKPLDLGTPVLDEHGRIVNVQLAQESTD